MYYISTYFPKLDKTQWFRYGPYSVELSIFQWRLLAMVEYHAAPNPNQWLGFRIGLSDKLVRKKNMFYSHASN